jgi:hypothetical protein
MSFKKAAFVFFALLIPSLMISGCDGFADIHVRFAAYNRSPDSVILVVNGKEQGSVIAPNQPLPMMVEVPIPLRPGYGPTGVNDEVVSVSVAFMNLRTKKLSKVEMCQVGGKVVTTVIYNVDTSWGYENEWVECQSSY